MKNDIKKSNLIYKIILYELVSTYYITIKTFTQHYLLYVNHTQNKKKVIFFLA
jgi:hypothetical protein